MKIVLITEKNYSVFQNILPLHQKQSSTHLWGCIVDQVAVGTLAMTATEDGCNISWLWVAAEYRKQGIGSALLDEACRTAMEWKGQRLTITYPADAAWEAVLEYMLVVRGFWVLLHTYPKYQFTKTQLMDSYLMKTKEYSTTSVVVPFSQVTHQQLMALIKDSKKQRNYLVSYANFHKADKERSIVLMHNGSIQGLLLVSTNERADRLNLDLLYLNIMDFRAAICMMKQAVTIALKHPAGLEDIQFTCIEEAAEKICHKLLGKKEPIWVKMCHGTLQGEMYQGR